MNFVGTPVASSSASASAIRDHPAATPTVTNEHLPLHQSPANCYDSGVPLRQERKMPSNGQPRKSPRRKNLPHRRVSRLADLKRFVLRYWETEFPCLNRSRAQRHRLYRQDDVDRSFASRGCSTTEGFTIAGARTASPRARWRPRNGDAKRQSYGGWGRASF